MSGTDWLRLVLLSILWGGSSFFVQVAVPHLLLLTIVWLRVALAALALAVALPLLGVPFPNGPRVWAALLVMGFLNNAVPFTLFVTARGEIPSGLAAILNVTTPLFTVIAAHLFTADERITGAKALGLALGFAGVVVMMGGTVLAEAPATLLAQGACLAAAVSDALAGVWGRRFRAMGVAPLSTAFG
jgi:drug/metabolite transporter (DMT)-like permease